MTSRERVLETLSFKWTDRAPYDLVDGRIWPELFEYFAEQHNLKDREAIWDFLGTDIRWMEASRKPAPQKSSDPPPPISSATETVDYSEGPMASAQTVDDIERLYKPFLNPDAFIMPDFKAFRERWPDHATAFIPAAVPYYWMSCHFFGLDNVFFKMADTPEVYTALLDKMAAESQSILEFYLKEAEGYVDIFELWDDMAGQHSMMINPEWWRKTLRPYLAKEVEIIRDHGVKVFFHSCGAVRPILNDLIEIGADALEVFQINAADMEPRSIAGEFGGKLAFYGGLDVQHLLSFGTQEEVKEQVRYNLDAFESCGGYIVANCHSYIRTIKGDNIVAMCEEASSYRPASSANVNG